MYESLSPGVIAPVRSARVHPGEALRGVLETLTQLYKDEEGYSQFCEYSFIALWLYRV